ncbi:ABC transporter substrate-binding protein [Burkholderia cenocepacia]|uniref:ABC transporter substrate-binding protein n=1 Tax=Burkholderia cenocepacia TaxID=95486 RepID=UPI001D0FD8E8|nr:ABC transporter substrate-binding protein [Burkholderia cenocepacia]
MRSRHLLLALAPLLLAVSAFGADTVVVGFAGALTGAQAHFGEDSARGIRLAIDEINAGHPSVAGHPVTFALDAQDDQADPKSRRRSLSASSIRMSAPSSDTRIRERRSPSRGSTRRPTSRS